LKKRAGIALAKALLIAIEQIARDARMAASYDQPRVAENLADERAELIAVLAAVRAATLPE
jgi:hypothetical protein